MKTKQFLSGNWSEVTNGERNEIVFEGLNKIYGAYEIRRNYDRALAKAFFGTSLLIVLLSVVILIPKSPEEKKSKLPPWDTTALVLPPDHPSVELPKLNVDPPKADPNVFLKPVVTDEVVHLNLDSILSNIHTVLGAKNGRPDDSATVDSNLIFGKGPEKSKLIVDPETEVDAVSVTEVPEFPGGDPALLNFIISHIYYPEIIKEMGGKGVVDVGFLVDREGNVKNVFVRHGSRYNELNEEAMRVVKMLPQWRPGRQQGVPVNVRMNLPVRFELKQ